VVIARLFNTSARARRRYGMVLRVLSPPEDGQIAESLGDGRQTRCFCYVTDTVEALLRLQNTPAARGEIFNVGTDEEVEIVELARRVIAETGSKSSIEFVPYTDAYAPGFEDMLPSKAGDRKLAATIQFRPKTSLTEIHPAHGRGAVKNKEQAPLRAPATEKRMGRRELKEPAWPWIPRHRRLPAGRTGSAVCRRSCWSRARVGLAGCWRWPAARCIGDEHIALHVMDGRGGVRGPTGAGRDPRGR